MSKPRSIYRAYPNVSKILDQEIIQRRKKLKLSQSTLAERAGVTRNCIQQLECHEHLPKTMTMSRLIDALNFSEEEAAGILVKMHAAYAMDRALQEMSEGDGGER